MTDAFLHDGAIQVVGTAGQGDLCQFGAEIDPVGFDVWEVVEYQAADCYGLQIFYTGSLAFGAGTRQLQRQQIIGLDARA